MLTISKGGYINIGEYALQSPLLNAGGIVKSAEDARRMALAPVGAVLGGSFTLDERTGNSPNGEIVYYHDPENGITYNSLGMPNKGLRAIASSGELQRMINVSHEHGKAFILNFAPVSDEPVEEVIEAARMLEGAGVEYLDALELNASCPNVVTGDGGRHEILSNHPQLLGEVLMELSDISINEGAFSSLFVRVSPFRSKSDALELASVLIDSNITAVSAFNTFPGGVPTKTSGEHILQVRGGAGGQSGTGMATRAEEQTRWLVDARGITQGKFEIIGSNGVGSPETMKERLDIGCVAVSATTLFWESSNWGNTASSLLQAYSELKL